MRRAHEDRELTHGQWQTWKQERGVGTLGTPAAVIDFFEQVRAAREQLTARDESRAYQQRLETMIREWEEAGLQLLMRTGEEGAGSQSGEALVAAVRRLRRRADEDAERRRGLTSLGETLRRLEGRREAGKSGERESRGARDALLAQAGVATEEEFRRRHEIFRRRTACQQVAAQCEKQLLARLGLGEQAEAWRRELATGSVAVWEHKLRDLDPELASLDAEREQVMADCGKAEAERRQIGASSDLAAKEAEVADYQEQFACALRQFRILA
jgi:hypothetical protein